MAKSGQPGKGASQQMKDAWRLYEAGDVVAARRAARLVLQNPASPQDADEARDLITRTGVPRQALVMAAVALAVILTLVIVAVVRGAR